MENTERNPVRIIRYIIASILCLVGVVLPYTLRMIYVNVLAFLVHLPYVLFGAATRFMFKKLSVHHNDITWQ